MDEYLKANQNLWNEWTEGPEKSAFYNEDGYSRFTREHKMIPLLFSLKATKPD
jgi:hypothetical protein